ncbi:hypothetical protein ANANG_G00124790 [Anguilla anguilla]|uniref:Uncharacterized protein n=1 Tax=Anguilla anguilla TaxID=7936 RepID=A0A9D3MGV9_ANGAN|nr:hypothetical protein ANANG_G00124790 [Anguilla anguilla]
MKHRKARSPPKHAMSNCFLYSHHSPPTKLIQTLRCFMCSLCRHRGCLEDERRSLAQEATLSSCQLKSHLPGGRHGQSCAVLHDCWPQLLLPKFGFHTCTSTGCATQHYREFLFGQCFKYLSHYMTEKTQLSSASSQLIVLTGAEKLNNGLPSRHPRSASSWRGYLGLHFLLHSKQFSNLLPMSHRSTGSIALAVNQWTARQTREALTENKMDEIRAERNN